MMKKIGMALVCLTMTMGMMAQPKEGPKGGCPQQGCKPNAEVRALMEAGVDSVKIRQVMDLKRQYEENYRAEVRKTLGDEAYIKYLEKLTEQKGEKKMKGKKDGKGEKPEGCCGKDGKPGEKPEGCCGKDGKPGEKPEGCPGKPGEKPSEKPAKSSKK